MSHFFEHLRQPEYVHVLLNPIPVYGMGIGVIALAVGLCFRSHTALIPALITIILSGIMAWPVYENGEHAYDHVFSMANMEGDAWLNTHMRRADALISVFYAVAGLAAMAVLLPLKWPRTTMPLAGATLILGLIALGCGGWIAYAGGKIRHPEFRSASELPSEGPEKEEDHQD